MQSFHMNVQTSHEMLGYQNEAISVISPPWGPCGCVSWNCDPGLRPRIRRHYKHVFLRLKMISCLNSVYS